MNEHNILGAILAGGKSKRMGKDKLFLNLNNKTLIEHTIIKAKKYLKDLIIITNRENEFFSKNNIISKIDHGSDANANISGFIVNIMFKVCGKKFKIVKVNKIDLVLNPFCLSK